MRSAGNHVEMSKGNRPGRIRFSHALVGITVLSFAVLPIALGSDSPVAADFGDAPDGQSAGYPPPFSGVVGSFPTSFVTANSRYGLPGGHTLTTGLEWLGPMVSAEFGPDDPADPDTIENFIDDDLDDGWISGPCASGTPPVPFPNPLLTTLTFQVSIAAGAPPGPRFMNVLIDKDHDGTWNSTVTPEWVVIDFPVVIPPGTTASVTVPPFFLGLTPAGTWMRVSLTRTPVVGSFPDDGSGWDGSGSFSHGEIEDYIFANALSYANDAASASASAWAVADAMAFDVDFMSDYEAELAFAHAHATSIVADLAAIDVSIEVTAAAEAAAAAAVSAAEAASDEASSSASAAIAAALCVEALEIAEAFEAECAVCPCATACASASASATASALACASASAAASAAADASASASAEASAEAAAAASAFAQASAHASAFAVAFALAQAQADAIAFAQAEASAFAIAFAEAHAFASASASASASAAAASLAAACGQNAQAAAAASASASSSWAYSWSWYSNSFAIALAFADAFAFAQAQAQALAFAYADAQVAATATAAASASAQASASAAASASASASASAEISGFVAISVEATVEASASASASATASCTGDCCDACHKTCPHDTFGAGGAPDGQIGAGDLAQLLGGWGECPDSPEPPECQTDGGCNDGDPCTTDSCDGDGNCQNDPVVEGTSCDDGDACTTEDACTGGLCQGGAPLDCDDGNPCTDDSCDQNGGCVNLPNQDPCDDGNACSSNDTCVGGECVGGPPQECDDGDPCTQDGCDPGVGCVTEPAPDGTPCDDGDACTSQDVCVSGLGCGGHIVVCEDSNPCTTDSCDSAVGCVHEPNDGAPCDDSNECTDGDTCAGGECTPGIPADCNDGNPCTDSTCEPGVGCVSTPTDSPCDDGNACTANDTCIGGECAGGPPIFCPDDGDPCTEEACDPGTGQCVTVSIEPCCGNGIREEGEGCDGPDDADCPGQCQPNCTCEGGGFLDHLTTCPDTINTSVDFGSPEIPAIPADFFEPGSDPFEGQVCFLGEPLDPLNLGNTDTIVRRSDDPFDRCELPSAEERTVEIELIALSLVSCEPITVTYNGGQNPEQWMLALGLSDVTPPPGNLTATKEHCNGGTFDSTLNVQPLFRFTRESDGELRVLDTGLEGVPHLVLVTPPSPWLHVFDADLDIIPSVPRSDFMPGIDEIPPCAPTSQQQLVPFPADSAGNGVRHCVLPAQEAPQCGNGVIEEGEQCDDGNNCPGDGCDENCQIEGGGGGDCCVPNGSPGCDEPTCQDQVCQVLPHCCDVEWDEICAQAASEFCPGCGGGLSDCCFEHNSPGCDNPDCMSLVCVNLNLQECCDAQWFPHCAQAAIDFCGICVP